MVKQLLFQPTGTLFWLDPLDNVVPTGKTFALAEVSFSRTMQLEASRQHQVDPLALSFCATIQHLSNFACLLAHATEEQRAYEYTQLMYLVSTEKLPFRPNRVEPRAVKRRPKAYPKLTKPRKQLKRKLMNDRYFARAAA